MFRYVTDTVIYPLIWLLSQSKTKQMDFHDNILGHLDTPQIFNMRVMKDVQNKFKVTDYQH